MFVLYAAALIEGKLKLPRYRPASLGTLLRDGHIASRYEKLTRDGGKKEDAITAIAQEFRCTRQHREQRSQQGPPQSRLIKKSRLTNVRVWLA